MGRLNQITLFVLAVMFLGCSASNEQDTQMESMSSETTMQVVEHHLNAFGENDLEAIISDYTDESIIVTPDSTYKGREQIRAFFTGLLPSFPTEGTTLEMDKMVVENELAYIIWHATSPSVEVSFGTDTFIVEDGKIKRQTFAGVMSPVE